MYPILLAVHNIIRWFVLAFIIFGTYLSLEGLITHRKYGRVDRFTRAITSGSSHIQLLVGLLLYASVSPITRSFMQNGSAGNSQVFFFGVTHALSMILAVILITIGAALAKRASADKKKFKVTLLWFGTALVIILGAIPWFRPFFRNF